MENLQAMRTSMQLASGMSAHVLEQADIKKHTPTRVAGKEQKAAHEKGTRGVVGDASGGVRRLVSVLKAERGQSSGIIKRVQVLRMHLFLRGDSLCLGLAVKEHVAEDDQCVRSCRPQAQVPSRQR